jgi:hypothetical protein
MSSNQHGHQQEHQQQPKQQPKTPEPTSGITFLRRPTVLKRLDVGATTLFEGIDRGVYPPPVQFSLKPNTKRPISLWAEHEITAAQQKLISARDEALATEHQRPARQRTSEGKFAAKTEDRQETGDS